MQFIKDSLTTFLIYLAVTLTHMVIVKTSHYLGASHPPEESFLVLWILPIVLYILFAHRIKKATQQVQPSDNVATQISDTRQWIAPLTFFTLLITIFIYPYLCGLGCNLLLLYHHSVLSIVVTAFILCMFYYLIAKKPKRRIMFMLLTYTIVATYLL